MKRLHHVRHDDLNEVSGEIGRGLTAKRGDSSGARGRGNEAMTIYLRSFNGHKKVARLYLAAIMVCRAKDKLGVGQRATEQIGPDSVIRITLQYVMKGKHPIASFAI